MQEFFGQNRAGGPEGGINKAGGEAENDNRPDVFEEDRPVPELGDKVDLVNIDIHGAVVVMGGEHEKQSTDASKDGGDKKENGRAVGEEEAGHDGTKKVGQGFEGTE